MDEIKIVMGSGSYNNNPGWLHTQEKDPSLLDERTWKKKFNQNFIQAILAEHVWEQADGVIFRLKKIDPRNQGEFLIFPSLIVDAVKMDV